MRLVTVTPDSFPLKGVSHTSKLRHLRFRNLIARQIITVYFQSQEFIQIAYLFSCFLLGL